MKLQVIRVKKSKEATNKQLIVSMAFSSPLRGAMGSPELGMDIYPLAAPGLLKASLLELDF